MLEYLLRIFLLLIEVSQCWDIIQLILPCKHYHGEPLYVRWRGLALLVALLMVIIFHASLGAPLAWLLGIGLFLALVIHLILLYERSEYPDR